MFLSQPGNPRTLKQTCCPLLGHLVIQGPPFAMDYLLRNVELLKELEDGLIPGFIQLTHSS